MKTLICDSLDYSGELWRLYLIEDSSPRVLLQRLKDGSEWIDCPLVDEDRRYQDVMVKILKSEFGFSIGPPDGGEL
jgi:hypothetical protein